MHVRPLGVSPSSERTSTVSMNEAASGAMALMRVAATLHSRRRSSSGGRAIRRSPSIRQRRARHRRRGRRWSGLRAGRSRRSSPSHRQRAPEHADGRWTLQSTIPGGVASSGGTQVPGTRSAAGLPAGSRPDSDQRAVMPSRVAAAGLSPAVGRLGRVSARPGQTDHHGVAWSVSVSRYRCPRHFRAIAGTASLAVDGDVNMQ